MPTIHVTNWSMRSLHRGRVLTIMAKPRAWEHGAGKVDVLTPRREDLDAVKSGAITVDVYHERFLQFLRRDRLPPGLLSMGRGYVEDGDTICCSCSLHAAAEGKCHRVWAAQALHEAGWTVVLDGVVLGGG